MQGSASAAQPATRLPPPAHYTRPVIIVRTSISSLVFSQAYFDLASNQHGWQWTAGTGTDPAPYFRIFNPTSQGRKFDPDGRYVRRWVTELSDPDRVPDPHDPDRDTRDLVGYPAAIVDHQQERREALDRWEAVR